MEESFPACFTYGADLRNLLENHEFIAREYIILRVKVILINPPYNVRRSRSDDKADYDTLRSNNMKHIAKVMASAMNPGK